MGMSQGYGVKPSSCRAAPAMQQVGKLRHRCGSSAVRGGGSVTWSGDKLHSPFFLLAIDEWHSPPCCPLPSPPAPALYQGVTAGKLQPQVNEIPVQQGCLTTLTVQDQHRGQRSRAGPPPGTGISQHTISAKLCSLAGRAWIFLWFGFFFLGCFLWVFFFSSFPSLSFVAGQVSC